MTRVVVDAGICGFKAVIGVSRISKFRVGVTLVSNCEMLTLLGEYLEEIDWREALRAAGGSSPLPPSLLLVNFLCLKCEQNVNKQR